MDILEEKGAAFLGSRLKRLAERMQAGAAQIAEAAGLSVQPGHMGILAALDDRSLTVGQLVRTLGLSQPGVTRSVGQLVELGLARSEPGQDQRQRTVSLTDAGRTELVRAKLFVWPKVEEAVSTLLGAEKEGFMSLLSAMEAKLAVTPLDELAARSSVSAMTIHEFTDELAPHFRPINAEWIGSMFSIEPTDDEVLDDPRGTIIDRGGIILFVETQGLGIVGTCALQPSADGAIELTKMGVLERARGMKAGEYLLAAIIERARRMAAEPLYLLTNSRCASAIHLYEKFGFKHDAGIMARYGARYARCDVAMRFAPDTPR